MVFSKSFQNGAFPCLDDVRVSITHIETHGENIHEMSYNATVSFEDWHGNCVRFNWCLEDLSQKDYDKVIGLFSRHLAGVAA